MEKKLMTLANQLLDLGKRNRLLNFKDQGLKSLMVLNTKIEDLFRGIKNGREFAVFDTDAAILEYRKNNLDKLTLDPYGLTPAEVYDLFGKQVDGKDILFYKKGYQLDKVIKALCKDYQTSIIEKGINSLYISFGFIHYIDGEEEYTAPLLLVPIEIVTEGGHYVVKQYEDEILLNPTLKYYFESMLNVSIYDYNYEGYSTYIEKIKDVLPDSTYYTEGAAIGIYSFFKMNMYNDIVQNKEVVVQNKNIQAILGEPLINLKDYENEPIYPVVNFDSSQLEAIQLAANGKSFCLQGPPGSGKSQTITNIISSLLGAGKKILFVSEKIAALRVVFENLRRAGLSEFAIEIHSNKTNKKEFIDDLYNTAVKPKYDINLKTRLLGANYENLKQNLRNYEKDLYAIIPAMGMNLLDLYAKYLAIELELPDIDVDVEDLNMYDLEIISTNLRYYSNYTNSLGYDYRQSPLFGITSVPKYYLAKELDDDLLVSIGHIQELKKIYNLLTEIFGIQCDTIKDVYLHIPLLEKLLKIKSYNSFYLEKKNREKVGSTIRDYLTTSHSMNMDIFKVYRQAIINENLEKLLLDLKNNNTGIFKNKEFKDAYQKVLSFRNDKAKPDEIIDELNILIKTKKNITESAKLNNALNKYLGDTKNIDIRSILVDMQFMEGLPDYNISVNAFKAYRTMYKNQEELAKFTSGKDTFIKLVRMLYGNIEISDYSIDDWSAILNQVNESRNDIPLYLDLNDCLTELDKYEMLPFLHAYLDKEEQINIIHDVFTKLFYKKKIEQALDDSKALMNFSSESKDEVIANFIVLDEKILNINRDHIISVNSLKRPDETLIEGTNFKLLAKEHEKTRRQMPIRQMLDQIFELALDVKPVFLMSPLSVSTYLASKLNMFDCVIFDEASQIFASDALGAIYRAHQCIVIGDRKQMPPTSFFQVGVDDVPEEFDSESILDKASNIFYTASLKWHYRSRSEELITFSNQSFYDSNLITVPQAKEHEKGFGIDFYFVSDGRYDTKSRTNPKEAQKVCDMVFDHYNSSVESLGVVAFSNVQAELIAELIERRLRKEPEMRDKFYGNIEEPLFVKNLESVQGDERDRIIFSICYGYNEENKFYQRFGPLNSTGGERRLNVAITRAKFNVSVVSSIKASDINTATTGSLGVHLLRDYLEFAEHTTVKTSKSDTDNGILNSVKEYLESEGYQVYPNMGASSFKIDLAVKKDKKFVLAIMVDSKSDYSSNLTDKYRLEKLLLERRGWRYFKLYSTSWYTQNEQEKDRLNRALNGEEAISEIENRLIDSSYLVQNENTNTLDSNFDDYQEMNIERAKEFLQYRDIEYVIREIVRIESPIHEELLCKKVAAILDKTRVTPQIREIVESSISNTVAKKDNYYIEDTSKKIQLRVSATREIQYIHPDELTDGVCTIIDKNNGVSIEGVIKAMTQLLGLPKVTPKAKEALDAVIKQLLNQGSYILKGSCLYTK